MKGFALGVFLGFGWVLCGWLLALVAAEVMKW
jgi:hypothetical protein